LAAPIAYEQPTLGRAWHGVRRHLLTLAVIILISGGLNLVGYGLANLLFGGGVDRGPVPGQSPLFEGDDSLRLALHQLLQTPFGVVANLVGVLLTAVPALYYETGKVITVNKALQQLLQRPVRYLLAGVLSTLAIIIGLLLCILPGLAVVLVMPVYINRIFVTDQPIVEALLGAFQAVYGHAKGWKFLLTQLVAWLLMAVIVVVFVLIVAFLAIGVRMILDGQNSALLIPYGALALAVTAALFLGAMILSQMAIFYVQNSAYRLGILS
jgi:hypothetical protein